MRMITSVPDYPSLVSAVYLRQYNTKAFDSFSLRRLARLCHPHVRSFSELNRDAERRFGHVALGSRIEKAWNCKVRGFVDQSPILRTQVEASPQTIIRTAAVEKSYRILLRCAKRVLKAVNVRVPRAEPQQAAARKQKRVKFRVNT
jgi:hypothetical protein